MSKLICAIAILAVCMNPRQQVTAQPDCDVLKVALEHAAQRFAYDVAGMRAEISESGDLREITFLLPDDAIGGAPVVIVDVRACAVVRSYMTQ